MTPATSDEVLDQRGLEEFHETWDASDIAVDVSRTSGGSAATCSTSAVMIAFVFRRVKGVDPVLQAT